MKTAIVNDGIVTVSSAVSAETPENWCIKDGIVDAVAPVDIGNRDNINIEIAVIADLFFIITPHWNPLILTNSLAPISLPHVL